MGRIISLATKKQLNKQDTAANNKRAASEGKYLGCIPVEDAKEIRQFQDKLITEQTKIDELIKDYEDHYTDYLIDVLDVLIYLGIDPNVYNSLTDKLMVGEDGHVWLVKNKDKGCEIK